MKSWLTVGDDERSLVDTAEISEALATLARPLRRCGLAALTARVATQAFE
jgi:hypothetical protein